MVTLHFIGPNKTRLFGDKPNWYRETPSRRLSEEVWVNHYYLSTADSFESGDGYSLHLTPEAAEKFKSPYSWWVKSTREMKNHKGYVSPKTIERILDTKDKVLFFTDER